MYLKNLCTIVLADAAVIAAAAAPAAANLDTAIRTAIATNETDNNRRTLIISILEQYIGGATGVQLDNNNFYFKYNFSRNY